VGSASFIDATAVGPRDGRGDAPGRYRTEVPDDWNAPVLPHGGVLAAIAARAMERELDAPQQALRSISVVFASPVRAGAACIDVQVLRRGRSISQVLATVTNDGEPAGLTAIGVFGASRPGFEFTDCSMPDVAPPLECPSFRDPLPEGVVSERRFEATFWEHAEGRAGLGLPWWDPTPRTSSEQGAWYRFDAPPLLDDGSWDPLAVVALCDTMPGAVGQRLGFRDDRPMWMSPSADLHVHLLGTARSEWLFGHNFCRKAGDGYASLEMFMWDPTEGLVAYATQQMFFSFPDGPPTAEQLTV
jgi:acyl-CoA thioesterase